MVGVRIESDDAHWKAEGEGNLLALRLTLSLRERGEQTGLETQVVHAVNDADCLRGERDRGEGDLASVVSGLFRQPCEAKLTR
jgi:hypothetical protein